MKFALKNTTRSLVFLTLLNAALIITYTLNLRVEFEKSIVTLRKNELTRLVTISMNSIQKYRDDYIMGVLSKSETIKLIADHLSLLIYEDETQDNYIFMGSYDGTMLVQPYRKDIELTNQWNLEDSTGKFIIRDIIEQAKKGSGFVYYEYWAPGTGLPQPKISYVAGMPELECYIGTGLYAIDLKSIIRQHLLGIIIILIIIFIIFIGSAVIVIAPLISSVRYIAGKLLTLGSQQLQKPLDIDISRFREGSDAQALVRSFADITERLTERNKQIVKTAEERKLLIREMNHRLKNNLQIMISLLQIQLDQTENDTIRKAFLETISRLESISIIHGMLYSGDDLTSISGKQYFSELTGYIIHSFGSDDYINLEYDFDDTKLSLDNAVPLGIITNEAITNSIKYAFPSGENGIIKIQLKSDGNKKTFTVSDNGVGMSYPKTKNNGSGLGINLITNLCRQMNGELTINTQNGTSYVIVW